MSDLDGSNALVATVQFYSQALARSEEARRQAEQLLRQALEQARSKDAQGKLFGLARLVVATILDGNDRLSREMCEALIKANDEYERAVMGRVEPAAPREGAVRGAPADGPADVPG